jgi:hypothetical protein
MLGTSRHTIHHTARHSPGWPTFQYETGDWGCGVSGPTPGPWIARLNVGPEHDNEVWLVLAADGYVNEGDALVCEVNTLDGADARLIAAAPTMIEALRLCIPANVCLTNPNIRDDMIVPLDVPMGDLRKIAAAIAKATHPTSAGERGR